MEGHRTIEELDSLRGQKKSSAETHRWSQMDTGSGVLSSGPKGI